MLSFHEWKHLLVIILTSSALSLCKWWMMQWMNLNCSVLLKCFAKLENRIHIWIKHSLFLEKKLVFRIWKLSKEYFVERKALWFWHVSLMVFTDKVYFWASIFYFWISCHLGFKSCMLSFSLKLDISATVGSAVKFYSSVIIKYQRSYFMAF